MKRRKNLERAVILGLLLSTSVYGSAFAVEPINETITDGSHNGTYNEDVIVDTGEDSAIEIDNDTISISTTTENLVENETGKIELNSNKYGIRLDRSGSVSLTAVGDNVIKVTANSTNKEIGDGINVTENAGGIITLNGANNTITVEGEHSDGIYTAADSKTNIDLIATAGNNTIKADNNGIDHRGNGTISLKAENGGNIISAGIATSTDSDNNSGDGIRVDGSGVVNVTGQYNQITADDNGIQIENGGTVNLTATNGNNTITANTNGIYAANSKVTLSGDENIIIVNATNASGNVNGILAENNSTVKVINGGSLDIDVIKNTTYAGNNGDDVHGLSNYGSNMEINTGTGNVDVNVDLDSTNNQSGGSHGISVTTQDGEKGYADAKTSVTGTYVNVNATNDIGFVYGVHVNADDVNSAKKAELTITATGSNSKNVGINIIANNNGYREGYQLTTAVGVQVNGNAESTITSNAGNINISGQSTNGDGYGVLVAGNSAGNSILKVNGVNTYISGSYAAISAGTSAENKSSVEITATAGNNTFEGGTFGILNQLSSKTNIIANSGYNTIQNGNSGIYTLNNYQGQSEITLTALGNTIKTTNYGIYSNNGKVTLTATGDDSVNEINAGNYGIYSLGKGEVYLTANENDNIVSGSKDGIISNNGIVKLDAGNNNRVTSDTNAVYAYTNADIDLTADENNTLYAGEILTDQKTQAQYGKAYAVNALSGSTVTLDAGNANDVYGAVYANGTGTDAEGNEVSTNVILDSANNIVKSYAVITGAGDLDQDETGEMTNAKVISALYAEEGAAINVTGENYIGTYAVSDDPDLERVVWAYKDADINIDGATTIKTDNYAKATNSKDIAIAAGTAVNLDYATVIKPVDLADRATVNVNYENYSDNSISYISGDILSAYEGLVNINAKEGSNAGISIEGNLLAGNNGILNVDIGKGGILTGRADDYGDAGVVNDFEADEANEHQEFYNPAFSSTIYKGGRVDLGMGAGSKWYVTGQSWITTIDTSEAKGDTPEERATIDLVTEYKDKDGGDIAAHALTVYDFKGDADFLMNLSGNRADTDMLYMKHADGNYRIMLDEDITSTDINQDKEGNEYSGLRFATVGADSKVTFSVGSYDNGGAFNVEYEVGQDEYGGAETAHENEAYNGTELNGGKPGDNMVDNFFGSEGEPVTDESANEGGISTASANGIMLMNEEVETFADEENNANKYNAINHKIVAIKDTELNDTGETILNMSRANYSNAIYMDRLNKRLGEARYINDDPEEDEGMWVRIRHDRIGKDDAYRSQNTMYELGYDKKQDCDNGERRVGFAVDYMHGDTGYTDIAGKGEIDRYGLWLYDTWMGDKGHYVDYVAKWGHLDNDFEVYTMRDGNKVTGDYSNNVFSVSAEYGRKKDIGSDWYFEPQAQLQLARVTGADYTTNQGTKVSVDGINSLIGRAGFRIGKDFGEEKQSTLYFKADVLHEFLGDQDVYVMDKSSDNKWAGISYDNEGTWYDIGIGYAAMMSKSSYAFIDLEQSFGNDNDDTYQINAGVRWTF